MSKFSQKASRQSLNSSKRKGNLDQYLNPVNEHVLFFVELLHTTNNSTAIWKNSSTLPKV